jgi:ubiquitin carboxyl-terminal hydrolase 7
MCSLKSFIIFCFCCCLIIDAITANFGGSQSEEFTFRHSTNAYMLVYVRDSYKHVVLNEVRRLDIPEKLQERLAEEKRVELAKKKERNEAHLYMQINILLESEFFENYGQADLFDPNKVEATKLAF